MSMRVSTLRLFGIPSFQPEFSYFEVWLSDEMGRVIVAFALGSYSFVV